METPKSSFWRCNFLVLKQGFLLLIVFTETAWHFCGFLGGFDSWCTYRSHLPYSPIFYCLGRLKQIGRRCSRLHRTCEAVSLAPWRTPNGDMNRYPSWRLLRDHVCDYFLFKLFGHIACELMLPSSLHIIFNWQLSSFNFSKKTWQYHCCHQSSVLRQVVAPRIRNQPGLS